MLDLILILLGYFSEDGGEFTSKALINQCPEVTAIVTFNDIMAAGLMASLQKQGIQIPSSISVAGFDDILSARYISSPYNKQ